MTRPREDAARPSKLAVTKMLAEAETRRRRAVRYSLAGLLVPLVVGGALLAFVVVQVGQKLREKHDLDEQIKVEGAEVTRLRAEKAKLEEDKAAIVQKVDEIKTFAAQAKANDGSAQALADTIQNAIASDPAVKNAIASDPAAAQATPRVYIQIPDESQRPKADEISGGLRRLNYVVKPYQVRQGPKAKTDVRYYRPEDLDAANKVAAVLRAARMPAVTVTKFEGAVNPGTLEVWFPPGLATEAQETPAGPDIKGKVEEAVKQQRQDGARQDARQQDAKRPLLKRQQPQ